MGSSLSLLDKLGAAGDGYFGEEADPLRPDVGEVDDAGEAGVPLAELVAEPERVTVQTYTTAPDAYDGFGTRTVNPEVGYDHRGQAVRLVETPEEHLEWQRARYGSGCHMAWDRELWDKTVANGIIVMTPEAWRAK